MHCFLFKVIHVKWKASANEETGTNFFPFQHMCWCQPQTTKQADSDEESKRVDPN